MNYSSIREAILLAGLEDQSIAYEAQQELKEFEVRQRAIADLLAIWDMSVDVLGPEWSALAEKIEVLR